MNSDYFIHPELGRGEVFLSNTDMRGYREMRFKSKRMGFLTYDRLGNPERQTDWFPVFIKQEEIMGKDLRRLRLKVREARLK